MPTTTAPLPAKPAGEDPILVAVDQQTAGWREETLKRAGYEDGQVKLMALRGEVDLHQAVLLIEQGCPHELAVAILV